MATRTTSQTGLWSASSTWGGSAAPGNGDTAVVNHDVTVDSNVTVGTSPSDQTTMAITIASGKAVTVAAGITLVVRGNVSSAGNSGGVILSAGAIWEWDASQALTTTTKYLGNLGTGFAGTGILTCNGSSGSPCIVRSNAGGGNGQFTFTNSHYAVTATYTTFLRIGDNAATGISAHSSWSLSHVTFDACGAIDAQSSTGDMVWADVVFQNSNPAVDGGLGVAVCAKINCSSGATNKSITRTVFDRCCGIAGATITYLDCYFHDSYVLLFNASNWTLMKGCLVRTTPTGPAGGGGATQENYRLHDSTGGNPHFTNASDSATDEVFDYPHPFATDTGDCYYPQPAASPVTVTGALVLPSYSDGIVSGFLATYGGSGAHVLTHCTVVGQRARGAFLRDVAVTGQIFAQIKSNLFISTLAATGDDRASAVYDLDPTASPKDLAAGSACTHNGFYNPISYTDPDNGNAVYAGYKARFPTSGTPGSNDVTGNPNFVDSTRSLATWAVNQGAAVSGDSLATKIAAALALLIATPTLTRSSLVPWVRAGFAPTNSAFHNTAHDGTDIGAVAYVSATVTTPSDFRPLRQSRNRSLVRR